MSIDLSLDRLVKLLPHLPYTRPTLHIAGTNGKGSVSALLTSILTSSSPPLRVGRFNSPHLVSVLDCITIDDVPITQDLYTQVRDEVESTDAAQGTQLTSFEVLTMTALRVFEHQHVDIVVLEVGMGGRLDATNVVPDECVLVSALAAVDLDHQAFLGDTVSLIAKEKAGIARMGRAFVVGRQAHEEVVGVVRDVVRGAGGWVVPALKVEVVENTSEKEGWSLLGPQQETGYPFCNIVKFRLNAFGDVDAEARLPLRGAHQLDNLGTALSVIDSLLSSSSTSSSPFVGLAPSVSNAVDKLDLKTRITLATIAQGIENVKWAGRLSFHTISVPVDQETNVELLVLADGAHNPASAKTLGAYITELLDLTAASSPVSSSAPTLPVTYILSLSHSPPKTPLQTLEPILPPTISSPSSSSLDIDLGVALLPFTPPQGMPWVKPVSLDTMKDTVSTLVPNLDQSALWVAPPAEETLKEALKWTARRHVQNGETKGKGLVVLAGSLYLVADFYRLMSGGF